MFLFEKSSKFWAASYKNASDPPTSWDHELFRILSSYWLAHFHLLKKSAKVLLYFGLDCQGLSNDSTLRLIQSGRTVPLNFLWSYLFTFTYLSRFLFHNCPASFYSHICPISFYFPNIPFSSIHICHVSFLLHISSACQLCFCNFPFFWFVLLLSLWFCAVSFNSPLCPISFHFPHCTVSFLFPHLSVSFHSPHLLRFPLQFYNIGLCECTMHIASETQGLHRL